MAPARQTKHITRSGCQARNQGSMLALIGAAAVLFLALGFFVLSYGSLFVARDREQAITEDCALSAANSLNLNDRVGRMNNLIAGCRLLVFNSAQALEKTRADNPALEPLAKQLHDQTRTSALHLEGERKLLNRAVFTEIGPAIIGGMKDPIDPTGIFTFGTRCERPKIAAVKIGFFKDMPSNVMYPDVMPDGLKTFDMQSPAKIDEQTMLYLGNENATLPAPDDDLPFNLSSLQAPMNNNLCQTRLISANLFGDAGHLPEGQVKPLKNGKLSDFTPSAVQVDLRMTLKAIQPSGGASKKVLTRSSAFAAASNSSL